MAIRTLTEFSGTLIRMAAKAETEAKKALPKELTQVAPAPVPAEAEVTAQPTPHAHGAGDQPRAEPEVEAVEGGDAPPDEKTVSGAFSSATEAADELVSKEKAEAEAAQSRPRRPSRKSRSPRPTRSRPSSRRRWARRPAPAAIGSRGCATRSTRPASAERVRLVRVFGGEDVVAGAKKIGEHQYLVDLMPHSMKQVYKDPKDEKGKSRDEAAERQHQEQERRLARGQLLDGERRRGSQERARGSRQQAPGRSRRRASPGWPRSSGRQRAAARRSAPAARQAVRQSGVQAASGFPREARGPLMSEDS